MKSSTVDTGHYGTDPRLSLEDGQPALSRGIPSEKALSPETMIVGGMNGEDLPSAHGYPIRIVVPGFIGSANQKWLNRIWVRDRENDGPGMTGLSYRMPRFPIVPGAEVAEEAMDVLTTFRIKSKLTRPETGGEVSAGEPLRVRGHAWSGETDVADVEVSMDFGVTGHGTEFTASPNKHAWATFAADVAFPEAGYCEIWARATDGEGVSQPMVVPGWNPRGYGNNATHQIAVTAV